ncbi:MAG: NAD-dependent epimerase/dehydratase family protein [Magnetospirillum sp.]
MSTILVTGASGYVGGRIARHLLTLGHQVRLASRAPSAVVGLSTDTDWVRLDWQDDASLNAACAGCDFVVHLAGLADADCARDPVLALRVNGEYSVRLLEAAIGAQAKRFVLFSTAHVYGAALTGTVDETTLPLPRHPYGISNRVAEDFVLAAGAQGRIGGLVLRLSNAIGAPVQPDITRWNLLVNDLCLNAAQAKPMVMRSSGMTARDFVPLADVQAALAHLLTCPLAAWGDGLMNLGSGRSISVAAMADLIVGQARAKGLSPQLQRPEPAAGEVLAPLHFGIERLRAAGFTPAGDIAAAIDETLDFCLTQVKSTP